MLKMRRGQGNRHFQMSKPISIDMRRARSVGHRERLVGVLSQLRRARAAVSYPVERIARCIDDPEQGLTDGRHAGEAKDVPFEAADAMRSKVPSVDQPRHNADCEAALRTAKK
jgi:hypothetical protein